MSKISLKKFNNNQAKNDLLYPLISNNKNIPLRVSGNFNQFKIDKKNNDRSNYLLTDESDFTNLNNSMKKKKRPLSHIKIIGNQTTKIEDKILKSPHQQLNSENKRFLLKSGKKINNPFNQFVENKVNNYDYADKFMLVNSQKVLMNPSGKINQEINKYIEDNRKLEAKIKELEIDLDTTIKQNSQLNNDLYLLRTELRKEREKNIEINEELKRYKRMINIKNISDDNFGNNLSSIIEEEEQLFPRGEQYYQLIKDINITNEKKHKGSKDEPIQIFFTLNDIYEPYNKYSFGFSIINSSKIDNSTFLGNLENKSGNIIEFGTSFKIDYFFEREQTIIAVPIINGEEEGENIRFQVSELMKNPDNKLSKKIEKIGTLQISYLSIKNQSNLLSSEISTFEFYISLNNEDFFGTKKKLRNCYFVIKNFKDGESKRSVYKSYEYDFEINKINKTSLISFISDILCDEKNDPIYFELYCPSLDNKNYIGFSSFNLNQLESNLKEDKFLSIKIRSNKHGPIGQLEINYNIKEKMSFQKFIKKGQINLDIAIDYTKSNGDPNEPNSLHYIYGKENDYEKAIKSCGKIIAYYDTDQLFPVYGFGGIPQGKDKVSHCFNITFDEDKPNILGIDKIIDYYKESLTKVKLSYPTYFSQIIKKVIEEINYDLINRKKENHYYILLILTDGIINDTQETIDSIVEASKLPLSFVIIGIGNNNFTSMEILDGDEKPLTNSSGEIRKRDIVQFVEFNKFKDKDEINCGEELAQEVLKEIPRQIEEYYQFCGEFYE